MSSVFLWINWTDKLITKDGNGDDSEFILLYEDYEGDRILVGDVPWE
jgi:AUX/IAA family